MDTSPVPAQSTMGSNKYKNALIVTLGLTRESISLSENQSTAEIGTWFPALNCLCLQSVPVTLFLGKSEKEAQPRFSKEALCKKENGIS